MRKLWLVIIILMVGLFIWFYQVNIKSSNKVTTQPSFMKSSRDLSNAKIIAENLEIPWALALLPDGSFLVTQRTGQVLLFSRDASQRQLTASLDDVLAVGEGGLLGIVIHPDFSQNNFIYLYCTYSNQEKNTLNRVVRYKFIDGKLEQRQIIVDSIPGASNHNGGRIKFGPDRYLYITTGDSQNPSLSQDKNSLAGKILRVTDEGRIPSDNPFNNKIYSYGHRNPQGLAWDQNKQLWATEHGSSAQDELNKIEKGANYGWPEITGDEQKVGMVSPVIQSGLDTWAPAGLLYMDGLFYFAGLRGQALYSYNPVNKELKDYFKSQFGRIREVMIGTDNKIYFTTSNKDGRAVPRSGDDKIIKIE